MEVHEMRKVRSVGAGSLALQQAPVHHAMAYICECGKEWIFTRKEVDTEEAHTQACLCGRTLVIQRSVVYGRDNPRSGSRKQPV
jgi:hypothetical protein